MDHAVRATNERVRGFAGRAGPAGALCVLFALSAGPAAAMTADGALMTNLASATWGGLAGAAVKYEASYAATGNVLVCAPYVILTKRTSMTMAVPGQTVTFTLCMINSSAVSSTFNVIITDMLPGWMNYINGYTSFQTTTGGSVQMSRAATYGGPYTAGEPPNTTGQPGGVDLYLRWLVNVVGPSRSACVSYLAEVKQ